MQRPLAQENSLSEQGLGSVGGEDAGGEGAGRSQAAEEQGLWDCLVQRGCPVALPQHHLLFLAEGFLVIVPKHREFFERWLDFNAGMGEDR